MHNDNDMIRRGDALKAIDPGHGDFHMGDYNAIAAIPAAPVPPEVQALVDALKVCEAELNQYVWQEYPLDHPIHERYRQRDFAANSATLALAVWDAATKGTRE